MKSDIISYLNTNTIITVAIISRHRIPITMPTITPVLLSATGASDVVLSKP
jgi:hypothetical protein